jgi:hypothetical protein
MNDQIFRTVETVDVLLEGDFVAAVYANNKVNILTTKNPF